VKPVIENLNYFLPPRPLSTSYVLDLAFALFGILVLLYKIGIGIELNFKVGFPDVFF
jgi:hypothetical protein